MLTSYILLLLALQISDHDIRGLLGAVYDRSSKRILTYCLEDNCQRHLCQVYRLELHFAALLSFMVMWVVSTMALRVFIRSSFVVSTLLVVVILHQVMLPLTYPTETYLTSTAPGPRVHKIKWDSTCGEGLILLSPNGPSISNPGPMMFDPFGQLVWQCNEFKAAANVKVQRYNGE